jgi:hypothetical protein
VSVIGGQVCRVARLSLSYSGTACVERSLMTGCRGSEPLRRRRRMDVARARFLSYPAPQITPHLSALPLLLQRECVYLTEVCLHRSRGRLGSTMGSATGNRRGPGRNSDAFTAQMAAHVARPTVEPFDSVFVSFATGSTAKDVQSTLGTPYSVDDVAHDCPCLSWCCLCCVIVVQNRDWNAVCTERWVQGLVQPAAYSSMT